MSATYAINNDLHGIEITFTSKPAQEIRESLKASGFRWHKAKKLWYARLTDERRALAEEISEQATASEPEADTSDWGGEASDGYLGAIRWDGSNSHRHLYGAELSAAIRADLKKHGVKGVTVKVSTYSGGQHITATIKATAGDFIPLEVWKQTKTIYDLKGYSDDVSVEAGTYNRMSVWEVQNLDEDEQRRIFDLNAAQRYNYQTCGDNSLNQFYLDNYDTFTPAFAAKVKAVNSCINSYRYDDSNGMVDYFDTNFYYDIAIKRIDL